MSTSSWRWGLALCLLSLGPPVLAVAQTTEDLNHLGKAAYGRGDFAAADGLFSQAIARNPRDPLLRYHRAITLTRLERWREAAQEFEVTLRLNPPQNVAVLARQGLQGLAPLLSRPRVADEGIAVPLVSVGGVWLTEVVLNDARRAHFLVDTGATLCVLSPGLAEAVGVRPSPDARIIRILTGNGPVSGPLVSIPLIRVGDVEATDVPAVILPGTLGPEGILGNTFLSRYSVTLDSARRLLHLRPR